MVKKACEEYVTDYGLSIVHSFYLDPNILAFQKLSQNREGPEPP